MARDLSIPTTALRATEALANNSDRPFSLAWRVFFFPSFFWGPLSITFLGKYWPKGVVTSLFLSIIIGNGWELGKKSPRASGDHVNSEKSELPIRAQLTHISISAFIKKSILLGPSHSFSIRFPPSPRVDGFLMLPCPWIVAAPPDPASRATSLSIHCPM